ncbi:MAG: hypothetical protein WD696_21535 [Bryobacteraceae bacterium]
MDGQPRTVKIIKTIDQIPDDPTTVDATSFNLHFEDGFKRTIMLGGWVAMYAKRIGSAQSHDLLNYVGTLFNAKLPTGPNGRKFAIEAAQLAVATENENFLANVQEKVFGLGSGLRMRAGLAKYLLPLKSAEGQKDRLLHVCAQDNPTLYVRQQVRDEHGIRHLQKRRPVKLGGDHEAVLSLDGPLPREFRANLRCDNLPEIVRFAQELVTGTGLRWNVNFILLGLGFSWEEIDFYNLVNVSGLSAREAAADMGLDKRAGERLRKACYRKGQKIAENLPWSEVGDSGFRRIYAHDGMLLKTAQGRVLWRPQ